MEQLFLNDTTTPLWIILLVYSIRTIYIDVIKKFLDKKIIILAENKKIKQYNDKMIRQDQLNNSIEQILLIAQKSNEILSDIENNRTNIISRNTIEDILQNTFKASAAELKHEIRVFLILDIAI